MPQPGKFTVLMVLALAATLAPVSIDMLTPALPGIAGDMGASPQKIELAIYSFLVGYGVAPSLWGGWSDRIGRRPIMLIGMIIYCASSLACYAVDSPGWLIVLRLLQGIGAAAGATMARAIIRDIYGGGGTTRGMARMLSFMSVVPVLMPLLGGYMARVFSWQACFVAMATLAAVSVLAYFFMVGETRPRFAAGEATSSASVWFIVANPVFAQHAVCNMFMITTLVLFGVNYSFLGAELFGFDSAQSGQTLALFNGSIALGTYLVWQLMARFDAHTSILIGACLCAGSWLLVVGLAMLGWVSVWLFAPLISVAALGCGVIMALCSGGALVPFSHNSGSASSAYLMLQSIGSVAISMAIGLMLPKGLLPITVAIAACAVCAILAKILFRYLEASTSAG